MLRQGDKNPVQQDALYTPDFIEKTCQVWGQIYGRTLTRDEALDIITRMEQLINLLVEVIERSNK